MAEEEIIDITPEEFAAKFNIPKEPPASNKQGISNYVLKGLDSLLMGGADELGAYGNAAYDYLTGQAPEGFTAAKESYLQGARESLKQTQEESPYLSLASDLLVGSLNPIGNLGKAKSVAGAVVKGVGSGALQGAVSSGLSSEGDLEQRATDALAGGAIGGALGGVLGGATNLLKSPTQTVEGLGKAAENLELSAYGFRPSELKVNTQKAATTARKAGEELSKEILEDSSVRKTAAKNLAERGVLKGADPVENAVNLGNESIRLQNEVDNVISSISQGEKLQLVPDDFQGARKFIQENVKANERPAAYKKLAEAIEPFTSKENPLTEINKEKRIIWGASKDNSRGELEKGLDEAIGLDLKNVIEDWANIVDPGAGEKIKSLNKEWGEIISVAPMIERQVSLEGGKSLTDAARDTIRTSGGIGSLIISGNIAGGPGLGALAGIGGAALASRGGKLATSKALGGISTLGGKALEVPGVEEAVKTTGRALENLPRVAGQTMATEAPAEQAASEDVQDISIDDFIKKFPEYAPMPEDTGSISTSQTQETAQPSKEQPANEDDLLKGLIPAIIKVESGGNPKAVSKVGAKGLMQLMPAMAKAFNVSDPFDPEENVRGGTALLKEELGRFKDPILAIAAYNAGSPAINRAIKKAGSTEWTDIKQHLPKETQDYVKKVLTQV